MPSALDYYYSMTRRDMQQFLYSVAGTLVVGAVCLWFAFRWIHAQFQRMGLNPPDAEEKKHQASRAAAAAASAAAFVAVQHRDKRKPPSTSKPAASDGPADKSQAASELLSEDPRQRHDNDASPSAHVPRHIPRAAQVALIQRGTRLLAEKSFGDALPCFLAILAASVEQQCPPDASAAAPLLPAHLTECLRGVGQCYMGLGKPEVAVKFLHAERRVFEEMVVQAAFPDGGRVQRPTAPSIIASLLGGKRPDESADVELPKRCYTLSEVADACVKLGHPDIALAYRVKAAAMKQKFSGQPLTPESDDAALLAHTLQAYQAKQKSNHDADVAAAAVTSSLMGVDA